MRTIVAEYHNMQISLLESYLDFFLDFAFPPVRLASYFSYVDGSDSGMRFVNLTLV